MERNSGDDLALTRSDNQGASAPVQGDGLTKSATEVVKAMGGLAKLAAAFKTDADLEDVGAWMVAADGVRIKVRSQQSAVARRISQKLAQQYRAVFAAGGNLSLEQQDHYDVELCTLALVTDWEGMDDDGQPIACTEDNVRMVVQMLPHLRRQIMAFSQSLENYRKTV